MSAATLSNVFVHPAALCETDCVGEGTRIWASAHILKGAFVGSQCNIGDGAFVEGGARVGSRVTIKNGVMIWQGVTIEDDVFLGPRVTFTNDRFPRSPRMPESVGRYAHPENWLVPTLVRRGASIGAGAVICCGVTIGRFALVGAGAVVTHDVPDYRLVLGNPARPVGWVCRCGEKLNEELDCPRCGLRFELHDETLQVVS